MKSQWSSTTLEVVPRKFKEFRRFKIAEPEEINFQTIFVYENLENDQKLVECPSLLRDYKARPLSCELITFAEFIFFYRKPTKPVSQEELREIIESNHIIKDSERQRKFAIEDREYLPSKILIPPCKILELRPVSSSVLPIIHLTDDVLLRFFYPWRREVDIVKIFLNDQDVLDCAQKILQELLPFHCYKKTSKNYTID